LWRHVQGFPICNSTWMMHMGDCNLFCHRHICSGVFDPLQTCIWAPCVFFFKDLCSSWHLWVHWALAAPSSCTGCMNKWNLQMNKCVAVRWVQSKLL
jgi:hypothetical protein